MTELAYERFSPPRRLSEYVGIAGSEIGGLALSPAAFSALADSKTSVLPCELVVVGVWSSEDGRRYLEFAATTDYIEAVTDYRFDREAKRLRLVCPECGMKDGKHTKGCDR